MTQKSKRVTFRKDRQMRFSPATYRVSLNGTEVGKIQYGGGRWFWYTTDFHVFNNTALRQSPTTFEECKNECREFFKSH